MGPFPSPGPFRKLGPRALRGKLTVMPTLPLPSACCVLGTVPSGLSVIAHVISPVSLLGEVGTILLCPFYKKEA